MLTSAARLAVAAALLAGPSGCGGTTVGIMVSPPGELARGERGTAVVTVRYGADSGLAGQAVVVRLRADDALALDPPQAKVTLDAAGSGSVPVYVNAR